MAAAVYVTELSVLSGKMDHRPSGGLNCLREDAEAGA